MAPTQRTPRNPKRRNILMALMLDVSLVCSINIHQLRRKRRIRYAALKHHLAAVNLGRDVLMTPIPTPISVVTTVLITALFRKISNMGNPFAYIAMFANYVVLVSEPALALEGQRDAQA
jgi:hypothetical protein